MIDYLILYEHKTREYENVLLLKVSLEKKGYSVIIEQVNQLFGLKYINRVRKPKVIITFSMYNDHSLIWQVLSVGWNVRKVVNLQWEQIYSNSQRSVDYHTPSENATKAVHICWGDRCKDRLRNSGVKNAVVTGAIQLDFLRPAFSTYFLSKETLKQKYHFPNGRMILFISSFTQVGLKREQIKELSRKLGDGYINGIPVALATRCTTIEWLCGLLESDPECFVVYRPHPGEHIDQKLEDKAKKAKGRFYIIKDYAINQWIKIADFILTWTSTSIAEVFFANKQCYILRPYDLDDECDMQLYKGAYTIDCFQTLLSVFNGESKDFPVSEDLMYQFYDKSIEYSYLRVIKVLEQVYKEDAYDIKSYPINLYYSAAIRIIKGIIVNFILNKHISSEKIIFRMLPKIAKKLDSLYNSQRKLTMEMVSKEESEEIERRLKTIINIIER